MNPRLLRPLARFQAPPADPFATLVSTKSTGNISGTAQSTTGYIKVEWWDSTTNVYGTGNAAGFFDWSKAAGAAGEKTIRIYPSDASGNLDGSLTALHCTENALTSLNASGLTGLTILACQFNALTSLDVSGLTSLSYLSCQSNALTSLGVSGCAGLGVLDCSNNALASLGVSGSTGLSSLYCANNSLTSLDVGGLTSLEIFHCQNNALTSLDISGCTALVTMRCRYNSLTSLRAQGASLGYGYYYNTNSFSSGVDAQDNQLSAAALNQFYTDLANGASPLIVGNNPGTTGDDPSIATNKGYTVYGS